MSIQGVFTFSTRVAPSVGQESHDSSNAPDPALMHLVADILTSPLSDVTFDTFYIYRALFFPVQLLDALIRRVEHLRGDQRFLDTFISFEAILRQWMTNHWADWDENKTILLPRLTAFLSRREQLEDSDNKLSHLAEAKSPRLTSSKGQDASLTSSDPSSSPQTAASASSPPQIAQVSTKDVRLRILELVDVCVKGRSTTSISSSPTTSVPSPWTPTSSPALSRGFSSSNSGRSLQAGAALAAVAANLPMPISNTSTASPSPFLPQTPVLQIPLLTPILPKTIPVPLRKIHPEEVARQITLLQWQLFSNLNLLKVMPGPNDVFVTVDPLSSGGTGPSFDANAVSGSSAAPGPSAASSTWAPFGEWNSLNSHLSRWAATCIVTLPKISLRVKTLQFLIEVAYFCHKVGNWEACQCLLEGLKMLPLPATWAALPTKVKNLHEMLSTAFKSLSSNELLHTYHASPYSALVSARIQSRRQLTTNGSSSSGRSSSGPTSSTASPSTTTGATGTSASNASQTQPIQTPAANQTTGGASHVGSSISSSSSSSASNPATPLSSSPQLPSAFSAQSTVPPHIPVVDSFVQSLFAISKAQARFLPQPHKRWLSKFVAPNDDTITSTGETSSSVAPSLKEEEANFSASVSGATSPLASSFSVATSPPTSPIGQGAKVQVLNPTRAKSEALILSLLQSFQRTPFPFAHVPWIAELISKAAPLSEWTIQEYCETLEPPKFLSPGGASGGALDRKRSSPRHISSTSSGLRSPPKMISPGVSPAHSRPSSPSSSPRECSPLEYAGIGISSPSSSPSGSWVEISPDHSPGGSPASSNSSPSSPALTPRNSASNLTVSSSSSSSSQPNFNLRSSINRDPFPAELELEKFGFYLYNTPPSAEISSPPPTAQQKTVPAPWWAIMDQDRIEDAGDDGIVLKFLLEFLPFPSLDSHFNLSAMKAHYLNMKTSKLTRKFKETGRLKWRKDFCFAAPTHSKGLRLSTYRLVNNEMVQYVPNQSSVTLTNASSAPLDFEFCKDTPVATAASMTKSQVFVSYSPSHGTIAPGKSQVVKITTTLLEEVQFYKFVKIQAFWPDMQYASFVPLLLVQTGTRVSAPIGVGPIGSKEEALFNEASSSASRGLDSSQSTPATTPTPSPRDVSHHSGGFQPYPTGPGPVAVSALSQLSASSSSSASTSASSHSTNSPDAYWKISLDDIKVLRRLGGSQAAVSLCLLHGAEVVLKKWDIGSLDAMPQDFLGELDALRKLRHPNLVQFIGASSAARGTAFIITEFASRGCLSDVLQRGDLNKSIKRKRRAQRLPQEPDSPHRPGGNASPPNIGNPLQTSGTSTLDTSSGSGGHLDALSSMMNSSTSSLGSSNPHLSLSASATASSFRLKLGIASDVAKGMAYMHYRQRIHRDLKSLNVLVDESCNAKIADLGSSKHWATTTQMTTGVGTFDWIAPEVLKSKTYSFPADVFSFGLILWELVHEAFPNRTMEQIVAGTIPDVDTLKLLEMFGFSQGHLLTSVGTGSVHINGTVNGDVTGNPLAMEYVALMQHCCETDPSKRPNFSEITIALEQIYTHGAAISASAAMSSTTTAVQLPVGGMLPMNSANPAGTHAALLTSNILPTMMMGLSLGSSSLTPQAAGAAATGTSTWAHGNFAGASANSLAPAPHPHNQRSGSKDAWVRAMKSTSSNAAMYYQQTRSPVSSPSTGSPLTPPNQQSLISLGSFDDFSVDDYMAPGGGGGGPDLLLSSPTLSSPLHDSSSSDAPHLRLRGLGPNKRTGRMGSSATTTTPPPAQHQHSSSSSSSSSGGSGNPSTNPASTLRGIARAGHNLTLDLSDLHDW